MKLTIAVRLVSESFKVSISLIKAQTCICSVKRGNFEITPLCKDDFCTLNFVPRSKKFLLLFFVASRSTDQGKFVVYVCSHRFCWITLEQSEISHANIVQSEIRHVNMSPSLVWPSAAVWHVVQQTTCRILQVLYFSEAGFAPYWLVK